MKNRQLSLSDIQKDYISKEEFYQIAHICKETALWLIETGRVSAEKPKRKGFGYKIAKEEVERYLADRQQNPLYYLKGKRHNCIPYTPPQPYSSELGGAIRLAVEQEMSSLPDLLTEKQVCAILGYRPKQILDWKHSGKLIALKCFNKTYFPMSEQNKIQLFENQPIRTAWNEEQEEWYFSVVDVIHVLTGSENPRRYWSDLKRKLKSEGATQLYENIVQLKMKSSDGKNYKTDAATTEQLLRIIQSIPSPRAEPVKRWLAEVGRERIEETIDPEQAIDRALETYLKKGYDPDWVHQRLLSIRIRNELTDEWQKRGVEKGREFAILTDEITRTWSGMTTRQYKNLKGLKKENLRDNMSDTELVLTMLAEASTRDISKASKPEGFSGSMEVARQGGEVAGVARKALEERTGAPVITAQNAAQMNTLVVDMIEEAAALPAQAEADDKE